MNVIAKLFKVSTPAVLTWIKNFAIANYEKPVPKDAILIEIDEMWHFLKSKKRNQKEMSNLKKIVIDYVVTLIIV